MAQRCAAAPVRPTGHETRICSPLSYCLHRVPSLTWVRRPYRGPLPPLQLVVYLYGATIAQWVKHDGTYTFYDGPDELYQEGQPLRCGADGGARGRLTPSGTSAAAAFHGLGRPSTLLT
jgi:hypothetical protein